MSILFDKNCLWNAILIPATEWHSKGVAYIRNFYDLTNLCTLLIQADMDYNRHTMRIAILIPCVLQPPDFVTNQSTNN